jgi:hypothetical protein
MPAVTIDARVWHDDVQFTQTLTVEICCSCAVVFAIPADMYRRAKADPKVWFYCPNGHSQHYTGKTEEQKLTEQLVTARLRAERAENAAAAQRTRAVAAEHQRAAYKGQATRLRKRIGNGVCPCCNRHFVNVERHMNSQHPGWCDTDPQP